MDYWKKHPPTHILVAAYLGVKAEPEEEIKGDDADLGGLLGDLAGAGGVDIR
jgi:hypothetical protein